jgi:hypothetical protein
MIDVSGSPSVVLRVTYGRFGELREDVTQQMARGGLLVKVHDASGLTFDSPVRLELVLPDGTSLLGHTRVLQVLTGFGVAVCVGPELIDQASRAATGRDPAGAGPTRHERLDPDGPHGPHGRGRPEGSSMTALPAPPAGHSAPAGRTAAREPGATQPGDGASRAEKIQKALHGTRDERNAILRDRDRTLHPFVLKNPQLNTDDVVTIAKNAQVMPDLLKQIGERKDWFQRPAIALAIAKNPKTPPELAVRALEHVPLEALRQLAKGVGVLPHVSQAARKRILG